MMFRWLIENEFVPSEPSGATGNVRVVRQVDADDIARRIADGFVMRLVPLDAGRGHGLSTS